MEVKLDPRSAWTKKKNPCRTPTRIRRTRTVLKSAARRTMTPVSGFQDGFGAGWWRSAMAVGRGGSVLCEDSSPLQPTTELCFQPLMARFFIGLPEIHQGWPKPLRMRSGFAV